MSKSSDVAIRFAAVVSSVRTLADGGIRLVLDLPETAIPEMAMLMQAKADGIALLVTIREDTI